MMLTTDSTDWDRESGAEKSRGSGGGERNELGGAQGATGQQRRWQKENERGGGKIF